MGNDFLPSYSNFNRCKGVSNHITMGTPDGHFTVNDVVWRDIVITDKGLASSGVDDDLL